MIIGLTGGIGSGKSTVAKFFQDFGISLIDADAIAHTILSPSHPAYAAVLDHFGHSIQTPTKHLDRKALRCLIFNNPAERLWLEQLLHPLIKDEILKQCAQITSNPYLIVEIPLLFESPTFQEIPDRIVVVDCDRDQQIDRIQKRDHSDLQTIETMLATQWAPQRRAMHADDYIHNRGSLDELKSQVKALHEYYARLKSNT
jgi:dephospho-CoA kinase